MRVLHVVRQFWPAIGGLENFVLDLASEQIRDGIEPEVLTLNRLNTRPDEVLSAEDEVRGIKIRRVSYFGSRRYPIAPAAIRHLRPFDLIHVHGVDFFCDFLSATRPLHGRPLVLSTHGGFFHTNRNPRLKRIFFSAVTRRSLERFRIIIASSVNDEALFSGIAPGRLVRIDNGVDIGKLASAASKHFNPSLIYFGRFAENKGLDSLIATFAELKRLVPRASLHLAGNDHDGLLATIKAQIARERLEDSIHIREGLDNAGLRRELSKCSFFVSASNYEGFGLALVEALSAGLIPVVSRIPSFEDIIRTAGLGKTIDFSEPASAAAEIAGYIDCVKAHYPNIQASGMEASKRYSWTPVARRFRACYEQVLGERKRRILGVDIAVLKRSDASSLMQSALAAGAKLKVAFANAHTLNLAAADPGYRAILRDFLVCNDGIGLDLASWMKFGRFFPENLNGTDFVPFFLSSTSESLRLYLVGSSNAVAKRAAERFAELWPWHTIVGWRNGFFRDGARADDVCQAIRDAKPDVVLVGMGNPLQELWIARNAEVTGAKLHFGVGALFDFTAGQVSRAPATVRHLRCEWAYRLAQEPRRLARRYLVGNPHFLVRAYRDRFNLEAG
jgi:alpha-1,3-mannosyltransferase